MQDRGKQSKSLAYQLPHSKGISVAGAYAIGPFVLAGNMTSQVLRHTYPWTKKIEAVTRDVVLSARAVPANGSIRDIPGHSVWITDQWSRNYFHWVTDALPRALVMTESIPESRIVVPQRVAEKRFVVESLILLGYPFTVLDADKSYRFEQLAIPGNLAPTGHPRPALAQKLRGALRNCSSADSSPRKRIWVSRARARRRRISNESEILPILDSLGFMTVHPESLSFEQQISLFSEAEIIAGVHGAGLTNMMVMKAGGRVIEIQRGKREWNYCYLRLASALQLDYWFVTGSRVGLSIDRANLWVNPVDLEQVLRSAMDG